MRIMRTKKLLPLLIAVLWSPLLHSQTCEDCQFNDNGTVSCVLTCPYTGSGCLGCCYISNHNQVCYTGGCCNCIPGQGCICTDQSGAGCNNFSCKKGTGPSDPIILKDSLGLSHEVPLKQTVWGQENALLENVSSHSRTFGKIVASVQAMASDGAVINEGQRIKFLVAIRQHYAVKPEIFWYHDTWRVEIDSPDPLEGPAAPNVLEIVGREWQLIHHIHGVDKGRTIVASGSY